MNNNTGFTLIEVLIAMLILAVGLLGLAALQATSLRNNQSAYYRSQATQLAYDIADRMRANVASADTYTTILPENASQKPNCLTTEGCTMAEMAENDLSEWNAAIQAILPSGEGDGNKAYGNITNPDGSNYTVTMSWDDNRDGDVDGHTDAVQGDADSDGDPDDDPFFQMSFRL
jgi:type IV pilus assembly protein PilV